MPFAGDDLNFREGPNEPLHRIQHLSRVPRVRGNGGETQARRLPQVLFADFRRGDTERAGPPSTIGRTTDRFSFSECT